ncbi:caspase family protein (plasmid) [Mesorhizobium sp. AR07]|uniref:caspase family protein n=1 Tax=Mesorhizobium sp. AR07 TaxID=2865838 RepID=UPI00215F3C82|nr:caspase family protein [Mesorhizobium sp. AR07]UVK49532.1 caspase family protein [Mesorhizobium sp. AR07]
MTARWGWLCGLAGAFLLGCTAVHAETRALVVGVSGYPNLPEAIHLVGPKNDAREVANTLVRLGVPAGDVTVLADGVSGLQDGVSAPGPGTRQAVLAGLDHLADTARNGDLIIFYFSGHGSQQPDLNGDEEGGFDQIFLPYDIGRWNGESVDRAIVDDELGARVQRILDKGADFFGILDACHSATGFRDIPSDDARARGVDPTDLGVPEAVGSTGRPIALERKALPKGRGRAAFFYAAQTTEVALEKTPKGAADGESYGVFTYTMLNRLNQTPDLTYRTLHQAVVADIKRNTLMATQTPDLEGDLLDEPVLRLSNATAIRQWPIYAGNLQAGQLAGLNDGAIVALYADPAAPNADAVAYGVVENAGATKSTVTQIAWPCSSPTAKSGSCLTEPDATAFKKGRFARVVEPGVDLSVTLSQPVRIDPADGKDYAPAIAALRSAIASDVLSKRVSMRSSGYDIAVALVDGKLAFSATGGQIDQSGAGSSPRLTLPDNPDAAASTVAAAINRIARALALQRLAGSEAGQAIGLESQVLIARAKPEAIAGKTCSDDRTNYEPPLEAGSAPRLGDCDIISVKMRNTGPKPVDVTVLLIGQDFSITTLWPAEATINRIASGDEKSADIAQIDLGSATASDERLVLIAVPGLGKAHTAFDNLEQEGLRNASSGDDATPEMTELHDLVSKSLNDMAQSSISKPPRMEEEMSIDVRPFTTVPGK